MDTLDCRISLSELLVDGLKLHPHEAVAIVRELCPHLSLIEAAGTDRCSVPSLDTVWVGANGDVQWQASTQVPHGRLLLWVGALLQLLLPEPGDSTAFRVPGPLRLAAARATGDLDVPPFAGIDEFADAIQRFEPSNRRAAIRDLFLARSQELAGEAHAGVVVPPREGLADACRTRRRSAPPSDVLRRMLRQADAERVGDPSAESRIWSRVAPPPNGMERRATSPAPAVLRRLLREADEDLYTNGRSGARASCRTPGDVASAPASPRLLESISDMRRARRASGLPLVEVARATGVPRVRLQELEWGVLQAWPPGAASERELSRYARATGLAEDAVLNLMRPLMTGWAQGRIACGPLEPECPVAPGGLGPFAPHAAEGDGVRPVADRWHRLAVPLALAASALVGAGLGWAAFSSASGIDAPAASVEQQAPASAPSDGQSATPARLDAPLDAKVATPPARSARPARQAGDDPPQPPAPGSVPVSQPAASSVAAAVDERAGFPPGLAGPGSAVFFQPQRVSSPGLARADRSDAGEVLHVATIEDDGAKNYHVKLSPDGEWIAFDSDRDGDRGIYVARRDGSSVRRVSGPGYASLPSWSPDGQRLVFAKAETGNPGVWNVWTVDLRSGQLTRLTSHEAGQPRGGSWLPDGHRIVYGHGTRLILLDLESGRRRVYRSPVRGREVQTPAVSPNGRWVIFQVQRDGAWLLDLEDGAMRRVLEDPLAEEFTWAPDGRRVAFHSRQHGQWSLWVMSP